MNDRGQAFLAEAQRTCMNGATAFALLNRFAQMTPEDMNAMSDAELRQFYLAVLTAQDGLKLFRTALSVDACQRFEISEQDARTDPRAAVLSLDARRFPRERITPNGA